LPRGRRQLTPRQKIAFAVGDLKGSEFKRQPRDLATAWATSTTLIVTGRTHIDLLDSLIDGGLLELALETAAG
jgi:hypothetical protein